MVRLFFPAEATHVVYHRENHAPGDTFHYIIISKSTLRDEGVYLSEQAMGRLIFLL